MSAESSKTIPRTITTSFQDVSAVDSKGTNESEELQDGGADLRLGMVDGYESGEKNQKVCEY